MASSASFDFPSNIDPRLHTRSNTYGGYPSDLSDVVANASEKMLEVNGHFVRIKMIADQRAMEIEKLQEVVASKTAENNDLTVEIRTLKEALELFARDYHENRQASSGGFLSISSEILPPKQALKIRTDNPQVHYWVKKEYTHAMRKQNRGETDGNATTVQVKRKRGRPPRESDDEEDHSAHFYLENQDGTPVDKSTIAEMSRKARMLWRTLDKNGLAPETFGKISKKAWDYFSRTILADQTHEFLLLCDDGEWKLREWSTKSYPSWYRNKHLPPKTEKNPTDLDKGQANEDNSKLIEALQNPELICMASEDSPEHGNGDPDPREKSSDEYHKDVPGLDDSDNDDDDPDTNSGGDNDDLNAEDPEQHAGNGDNITGYETNSPTAGPPDSPTPSSMGTHTPSPSVLLDPFAPVSDTPTTSVIHPPGTANEGSTANSTTSATATGLRIKLNIRATRKPPSDATDKPTHTPGPATHEATMTEADRINHDNELCPRLGTPSTNAHADETRATTSKKRKHQNTPATTAKKLKTSDAMAIPTEGNSVRNICMRSWNKRQPGGQGPLSEFDNYFKSLTNVQKELFKKEQRTAQATARKAKVAAKKANSVPNAN
ncbi:hypothetical protein BJY52DRAFT_1193331 [Lactarius psammicola]|nr:hypothetical protein BJY52DRAFT_1193331 [Lactarius psammicola]